jgi:hypothetical protein
MKQWPLNRIGFSYRLNTSNSDLLHSPSTERPEWEATATSKSNCFSVLFSLFFSFSQCDIIDWVAFIFYKTQETVTFENFGHSPLWPVPENTQNVNRLRLHISMYIRQLYYYNFFMYTSTYNLTYLHKQGV